MAGALSPALWKQKQCTLQNILETLESCLLFPLSHLHSVEDLEWKVKISNSYKLRLRCWEQLKCSCGRKPGAFALRPHSPFTPPHVAEVLLLRPQVINHQDLFSCQYIQKERPKPTMASLKNNLFSLLFWGRRGKYSSLRIIVYCSVQHKSHTVFIKSLSCEKIPVWTAQAYCQLKIPDSPGVGFFSRCGAASGESHLASARSNSLSSVEASGTEAECCGMSGKVFGSRCIITGLLSWQCVWMKWEDVFNCFDLIFPYCVLELQSELWSGLLWGLHSHWHLLIWLNLFIPRGRFKWHVSQAEIVA